MRGRRQVGKSRLLTEFVESAGVPSVYFTAVRGASLQAQMAHLAADISASRLPLPDSALLFETAPGTWGDALVRLGMACRASPCVVVVDEFPWLAEASPSVEGELQRAWDRDLQHLPVLVVLVGSDVSTMERLTGHDRPLFGRSREMVVAPFTPAECATALGAGAHAMAAFDTYLLTGGYPRLVADAARFRQPEAFAFHGLQDETSDLVVLGQRSLDAEFPPDAQARRVLSAIGAHEVGVSTFQQVVGQLAGDRHAAQTAVTRAVALLEQQVRVLSIDTPVGAPKNTKLRRYRIRDPYLRFWFRFVEPHLADISRGREDIATDVFRQAWPSYRGKAIEPVVADAVACLAPSLPGLTHTVQVGGWWNRLNNPEVDLVLADRSGDFLALGSVKWRARGRFGRRDMAELVAARAQIPAAHHASFLAVCPAGADPAAGVGTVLTPDELLSAWPG